MATGPWSGRSQSPLTDTSSPPTGPVGSLTMRCERPLHYQRRRTALTMLPDIVIDTNVLCHADNPVEPRCAASRSLMSRLLDVPTQLCVDKGFALDRARNRSHICAEYLDMVVPGSVPYAVLTHLFASGRVREVDRRPDHSTA